MKKSRVPPHAHMEVRPPTELESSQLDFLWKQHNYISDFVKFADTKAAFVSVATTAVLGALFSFFLARPARAASILNSRLDFSLAACSSLFLLAAIILTILVILPRLSHEAKPGPLSWIEVAQFESATAFTAASISVTGSQAVELMAKQVWHMARISEKKHKLVRLSIMAGLMGGTSFVLLMTHLLLFVI